MRSKGGVGKNSYVDESLFGGKKTAGTAANIISMDELRKIRTKTESNNQTDAVIITATDMQRIRDATIIKTKAQLIQEKTLHEEQKNAAMAKSKARKQKMMEMDAQRASKVRPTEY
jgi:hypothetical protein